MSKVLPMLLSRFWPGRVKRGPAFFFLCTLSLFSIVLAATSTGSRALADQATPEHVSLAKLVATPDAYRGRTIAVQGWLENLGTNYFTDLRIVLRGPEDIVIDVLPWLPLEYPPAPPNSPKPRPPALSDYLDKEVKLVGTVVLTPRKGVAAVDALRVTEAEILP